jgi:hypothetical protein
MPQHKKKNQPTLFCSSLEMAVHFLHIINISIISTCYTERRKSKRKGKEVAFIDVLAYVKGGSKTHSFFINSRYIAFSYDTVYSIYAQLTLPG